MQLEQMYQEIILDHYRTPHHKGLREPYDVEVHHVNPTCGDEITLRVKLDGDTVTDVSYDSAGCSISQASASILSDELIGMPVTEAARLNKDDIMELLGVEIGPARLKCALLALKGLKVALLQAGVSVSSYVGDDD